MESAGSSSSAGARGPLPAAPWSARGDTVAAGTEEMQEDCEEVLREEKKSPASVRPGSQHLPDPGKRESGGVR